MSFSITIMITIIADATLEYHPNSMTGDWNDNNVYHNYEFSHRETCEGTHNDIQVGFFAKPEVVTISINISFMLLFVVCCGSESSALIYVIYNLVLLKVVWDLPAYVFSISFMACVLAER